MMEIDERIKELQQELNVLLAARQYLEGHPPSRKPEKTVGSTEQKKGCIGVVYGVIQTLGECTYADIVSETGLKKQAVYSAVFGLLKSGKIVRSEDGRLKAA